MKIQILNENPNFLESVIKLGDKNNSTLGFYPEGAYQESARKKKIIIAPDSERVLGYLLWNLSVTMDIASIVHLCVDEDCRQLNYNGFINHYNLTANKIDCASLDMQKVLEEAETFSQ
ncbi:MAG: hypothetical protein HN757_17955, partial [Calditrichaeota bacterium]|nr:hypothetical protein [Calditrichota bacterium]